MPSNVTAAREIVTLPLPASMAHEPAGEGALVSRLNGMWVVHPADAHPDLIDGIDVATDPAFRMTNQAEHELLEALAAG